MCKRGLTVGLLALLLALALPAAAQSLDDFLGSWHIEMQQRGNTVTSTLTISNVDGKLAGVWKDRRGSNDLQDVAYADGKVTFKRSLSTPRGEFALDYELRIEDGKLAGKIKTPRGDRDFTGTRADS